MIASDASRSAVVTPLAAAQVARPSRRRRIGMALYGDLTFDSRVRKEARRLAEAGLLVTIACLADAGAKADLGLGVDVIIIAPPARAIVPGSGNPFVAAGAPPSPIGRRIGWLVAYVRGLRAWGRAVVGRLGRIDAWHVHDLTALAAIAPNIPAAVPLIYDSHELFLEAGTAQRLPSPLRELLGRYERHLAAQASAVVTVNDALAGVLRRRLRHDRVVAVHNCPNLAAPPVPAGDELRDLLGLPPQSPIVLYHGALAANRGIEQAMQAMLEPGLESAHLVLLGFGEQRELYAAQAMAPARGGRVHVVPPVPPTDLLRWVASADVGVMAIQDSQLSFRLSTPNKLFECLAAGVPVVASDFPAMRPIVLNEPDGPVGVICDPADPVSIARGIRSLIELEPAARQAIRDRCRAAAVARWNWQRESARLVEVYRWLGLLADSAELLPVPGPDDTAVPSIGGGV